MHFIYKEKSGTSKIKSSTENLASMIYESFILQLLILVVTLYSCWGDTNTSFKLLISKSISGWKDTRLSINFCKKQCLPVITWDKKLLLKQVITITYTPERKVFCSCFFWRFESRIFSDRVKRLVVYLVSIILLCIFREGKTKWILLLRNKLVFLCR